MRCVQARRRYQRAQRKRRLNKEEISLRYRGYRVLRRILQEQIKIAKDRAWSDLVEVVESDPWGRPCRTVTRKPCAKGHLATAELEPALLAKVIGTLFSPQEDTAVEQPHEIAWTAEWNTEWEVTEEELWGATRKMASRDMAAGLDGIPGRI
jgi:hypothetical protein